MFSRPKILFLVSLLFVALLNPKFNPYLLFKFLIFYHSSINKHFSCLDQSLDKALYQRVVQRVTHFPGLDIALCKGQYKTYYPAIPFDPPTQVVAILVLQLHVHDVL